VQDGQEGAEGKNRCSRAGTIPRSFFLTPKCPAPALFAPCCRFAFNVSCYDAVAAAVAYVAVAAVAYVAVATCNLCCCCRYVASAKCCKQWEKEKERERVGEGEGELEKLLQRREMCVAKKNVRLNCSRKR